MVTNKQLAQAIAICDEINKLADSDIAGKNRLTKKLKALNKQIKDN
jgi:hypothetical protein